MTHVEDFDDKCEGRRTIEKFYHQALKSLFENGEIERWQYEKFFAIEGLGEKLFWKEKTPGFSSTYDMYVACFSTEKDDQYMYDNYTKGKGCCIKLHVPLLRKLGMRGIELSQDEFEIVKVIYGNEIVETLMNQIRIYVDTMQGDFREKFDQFLPIFNGILDEMRFAVKREQFQKEHEVRLILAIPKGEKVPADYVPTYKMKQSEGKRYIAVDMPSNIFRGLSRNENFTDEEWKELKEYFIGIGYNEKFIE